MTASVTNLHGKSILLKGNHQAPTIKLYDIHALPACYYNNLIEIVLVLFQLKTTCLCLIMSVILAVCQI